MTLRLSDAAVRDPERVLQPGPELQALWFALAAREFRSVVLVPADTGLSGAVLAADLADVGRVSLGLDVELIVVEPSDLGTPSRLTAIVGATATATPVRQPSPAPPKPGRPSLIVAIPPVIEEPLGAAIVHAADAAVLCVERGRSRIDRTRRTVEILGRARIAGCFLIN